MSPDVHDLPAQFGALSLSEATAMLAEQRLPPVERWDPPDHGDSHIEIRADGSWWHRGGEIRRLALVRLFASILRREADGSYALVTPHEKQRVAVADLPLRAVEMLSEGSGEGRTLMFRLDTGELVAAGADHPLRLADAQGAVQPSLHVRGAIGNGIEARLSRSLYYEIAEIALAEGVEPPQIWSGGCRFLIGA
jgi:uncharacterized protein